MKFLGNVADVWQEQNHIVLIFDIPDENVDFRHRDLLELRRPDGSSVQVHGGTIMFDPPAQRPFAVVIQNFGKESVPVGTQVWLVNPNRPTAKPSSLRRKFERKTNS